MLNLLFGRRETLQYNLGYCRLYETRYNGLPSTKIYLISHSPQKYEFLKDVRHPNILPVYRVTAHSIFTRPVEPFKTLFDPAKQQYNSYLLRSIRGAVAYLHDELRMEHLGITMDGLFIDGDGNILLGKFDRCCKLRSAKDDEYLLNELSKEMVGREIDWSADQSPDDSVFGLLEDRGLFGSLSLERKREFIARILENREEFIERIRRSIIMLWLENITKISDEKYKLFVMESIFSFDSALALSLSKELFSILDTPIRLYLLRHLRPAGPLDACVQEACLGLKVKTRSLRTETISFLFRHEKFFSTKSFAQILSSIRSDIHDPDSANLVCLELLRLRRPLPEALAQPLYPLLVHLLHVCSCKSSCYKCIELYFTGFDMAKVSSELLPMLCSRLAEQESQDSCFRIVEKILSFLKQHKGEMATSSWPVKTIRGIFTGGKKPPTPEETVAARLSELSRADEPDDWADRETE